MPRVQGEVSMTRAELLDAAKQIVTQDRNVIHGEPEDTFGLIAAYWTAHLDQPVSPADVAAMMTLMKLARLKANPGNAENWLDGIGYLACGGEIATSQPTPGVHERRVVQCDDAPASVETDA